MSLTKFSDGPTNSLPKYVSLNMNRYSTSSIYIIDMIISSKASLLLKVVLYIESVQNGIALHYAIGSNLEAFRKC